MFKYVLFVIVGNEPVPFSKMLITALKLEVTLLAIDDDTAIDDEYCIVSVNLTNPFTLLTKLGVEPVPNSTISNTISKLSFEPLIKLVAIEAVVINCAISVCLVADIALVIIVGNEPVPFSTTFNTISKPLPILFISVIWGVIDDVVWVSPLILTPLFVLVTIVGIEPVPFITMFITFPNDADTIVLSDIVAELEDVYCVSEVTLIPFWVLSTNVGIAELPLPITLLTISKLLSIAISPIAANLANSLAYFKLSIVSVAWESVAWDGYK